MKIYQLKIDDNFKKKLKMASASAGMSMKEYIVLSVNDRIKNGNKRRKKT